ncbi:MAG TPA: SPFH domain-containing protein, partial [Gemmataceae bacterium]|nr:SPFH domain-containing protein [Gemmataceae bacterium]
KVDVVDATEIRPGFVGVVRRLLRTREPDLFGADGSRRGYLSKVLQPGLYYLNTKEFEVLKSEVGIYQTSFRTRDNEHTQDTAITFPCKGGFSISLDCTIEWEVLPEHMPSIVREYGSRHEVDKKVIDVQAHAIARDKGFDYTAQDLLEGTTRQKFQEDFTQGLRTACAAKNVTIHSAFIRRIDIPDEYLKPIRDRQIAAETEITAKAKEVTAETENDVEREQRRIQQAVAKVEAETKQKVANIEQQVDNVQVRTDAELEKLQSDFTKRITTLDSERNQLLGQAKADAEKLVKTATSSLYQMKMDVFKNDGDAFLRYTLADNLNPNLVLRLFHSGSGTFWTNMGNKNMNFLMPIAPAGESKPKAAGVSTDNAAEKDLEPKARAQKGTE